MVTLKVGGKDSNGRSYNKEFPCDNEDCASKNFERFKAAVEMVGCEVKWAHIVSMSGQIISLEDLPTYPTS